LFGDLEGILDLFESYDDVFVPEFGSILVEKTGDNSSQVRGNARQTYHMDQVKALDGFSELPSGPYFLYGPNLHQAWRLYDDELGAFTFGIVPDDLGKPDEYVAIVCHSSLTCSGFNLLLHLLFLETRSQSLYLHGSIILGLLHRNPSLACVFL
jgi:hypothetical protein